MRRFQPFAQIAENSIQKIVHLRKFQPFAQIAAVGWNLRKWLESAQMAGICAQNNSDCAVMKKITDYLFIFVL